MYSPQAVIALLFLNSFIYAAIPDFEGKLPLIQGKQIYAPYTIHESKGASYTYARQFTDNYETKEERDLYSYGSKLSSSSLEEYIALGEAYKESHGGFFSVIQTYKNADSYLPYEYILKWFFTPLELSSQISFEEMLSLLPLNGPSYFIHEFFETVNKPQNGDLVVYEDIKGNITHAGIYYSGPEFPKGGVVQSVIKVFSQAALIQHDVFLLSLDKGNLAKFYRIKDWCPHYGAEVTRLWQKKKGMFKEMYFVDEAGAYHFEKTDKNIALRRKIYNIKNEKNLTKEVPEIFSLRHIDAWGVCANYAFKKTLKSATAYVPFVGTGEFNRILETYFTLEKNPQPGDLAVYYSDLHKEPVHYGVYYMDEIVESKWGVGTIFRHPIFYVDPIYGDVVRFFRIKDGYTQEAVIKGIRAGSY